MLYICKHAQKQGIGRKLIEATVHELLAQEITSMLIWVLSNNSATKFYETLGGKYLRRQEITIGSQTISETAYAWEDLKSMWK
jgi:GNAT superfamily N-acetyltransferase